MAEALWHAGWSLLWLPKEWPVLSGRPRPDVVNTPSREDGTRPWGGLRYAAPPGPPAPSYTPVFSNRTPSPERPRRTLVGLGRPATAAATAKAGLAAAGCGWGGKRGSGGGWRSAGVCSPPPAGPATTASAARAAAQGAASSGAAAAAAVMAAARGRRAAAASPAAPVESGAAGGGSEGGGGGGGGVRLDGGG